MSPTVAEMVELWSRALGCAVQADDEFFEAGGTSLHATGLLAALRDKYGIELSYVALYDAGSPAELVDHLRQQGNSGGSPATRDSVEIKGGTAPMSLQQEAIWFLEEMSPGTVGYNSTVCVHIQGPLDHMSLRKALHAIVTRHPALRTRFSANQDGIPEHQVGAEAVVDLDVLDNPPQESLLIRQAGRHVFDLENEPPIRWLLVRRSDQDHLLVQVEHHFVHDGWSMWVVLQDLARAYAGLIAGEVADLGTDGTSYLDYCRWQREWLDGDEAARQLRYWLNEIGESLEPLQWPYEERRAPRFTYEGDTVELVLGDVLHGQVQRFAKQAGATPFAVLMAAYVALVGNVCQSAQPIVGGGLRNRRLPGVERTVGMFVNTFAMAFPNWADRTFAELTRQTTWRLADVSDHQELPFPVVAGNLTTPRDHSRNPVFQTSISINDWPETTLDFGPGVTAEVSFPTNGGAKFDLDVIVLPAANDARMLWRYSHPLFTRKDVEQLAHDYTVLVDRAIGACDTPLGVVLATKVGV